MGAILALHGLLGACLDVVLRLGRWLGVVAISVMVAVILLQVFCRYVLGNALPWPDEAARFFMLWMAGLMAPSAFRQGGFVAIDLIDVFEGNKAFDLLQILLLSVSLTVLIFAVRLGYADITGLGGRFATASLYLPTSLGFDEWYRIPRSWMMTSLFLGMCLLIAVNIELILTRIIRLVGQGARLSQAKSLDFTGGE